MPARSVSTDPSQNQSTIRWTARPATACRDAAGRYRKVQHGPNRGFLERTALFDQMLTDLVGALHAVLPNEFQNGPFQFAQFGRIVTLSSVTVHSVTDCST
jgi:hypothetical protein